jgi:hypothetical protein
MPDANEHTALLIYDIALYGTAPGTTETVIVVVVVAVILAALCGLIVLLVVKRKKKAHIENED